jgi:hypothetical protein
VSPGGALAAAILAAALAGSWGCSRQPSPQQVQAWSAEIRALQAEQDSLRSRAAELVAKDPRIQQLPTGEVVLSIPTAFLRSVIERVFDDVVSNTTLSLSGIKAHVAKSIKKVVTIGEFVLDVEIHEVIGKLRSGQPDIVFGENVVSMSLPVEVSEGHGEATLHFVWNGKNLADAACGDMDVTQKVTADVIPSKYVVSGRMKLEIQGSKVVCAPVFPETKVRIRVKPSKASWAAIDRILAEKHGVCGWVLDKVDVPTLLAGIVEEKGFNVKLPINKIKPFVLPGGVTDTVTVGDKVLSIATRMNSIRIDRDAIWYGAHVAIEPE